MYLHLGGGIVVSTASMENVLCLPHGKVLRLTMQRQLPLYVVTESPGSVARFSITDHIW